MATRKNSEPIIYRGEVYYADLSPAVGSEQGGMRPVVILQNNVGNKHAPTTIIAPLTSRLTKKPLPTHVLLPKGAVSVTCESVVLLEQVRVIDKQRLKTKMGVLPEEYMTKINEALKISLGL